MADEIKIGAVVQLKSGGPKMTVSEIIPNPVGGSRDARASWLDTEGKQKSSTFPVDSLILINEK